MPTEVDGPLFFNLLINHIVFFSSEIFLSNYTDEKILKSIGKEFSTN